MKGKRIPTGIPELDMLIEGGLRAGKTYLVVGEPGTGKTVFGLQFLVNGLMEKKKGFTSQSTKSPPMSSSKPRRWAGT